MSDSEVAIVQATDSHLRNERSERPFSEIFGSFFSEVEFSGKTVLDLGPGHFHFAEIARERGATVHAVEKNPEMIALGKHKDFEVFEGDIREVFDLTHGNRYEGVFCKYSFSALWYNDREELIGFVEQLEKVSTPDAWFWLAPWNGGPRLASEMATDLLSWQVEAFESNGFTATELSETEARRFGVHGFTGNRVLFTRNLTADFLSHANQPHSIGPEKIVSTLSATVGKTEGRPRRSARRLLWVSKLPVASFRRVAKALLTRLSS